eukprot:scaffold24326_cov36-Phaeocystis_antarctica.AAC.1
MSQIPPRAHLDTVLRNLSRHLGHPRKTKGWLHFYRRHESSLFTTGLPRDPPTQPQPPPARGSTPTDGAVKGLLRLGNIVPHGGLAGA